MEPVMMPTKYGLLVTFPEAVEGSSNTLLTIYLTFSE